MMSETIKKPPISRKWVVCPKCRAKVILYDNTAECRGVFAKCTRGCGSSFEIIIENGEQVL